MSETTARTVYSGRVFDVEVQSIARPDGSTMQVDIIRHAPSVVIVPVTESGELVLVHQHRFPLGRSLWELPAGSADPGESIEAAAIRECHEEIGLIPTQVEHLGAFFPTPGYCDEDMHFFLATGLRAPSVKDGQAHQDPDEQIAIARFTPAAVQAMLASGEIVDLKTLAGVALMSRSWRT